MTIEPKIKLFPEKKLSKRITNFMNMSAEKSTSSRSSVKKMIPKMIIADMNTIRMKMGTNRS